MDTELWQRLQAEPDAQKSSLELADEARRREHLRVLQGIKRPAVTAEQRAAAKKAFDAISAVNRAQESLEANDIIETRKTEIKAMILAACKDVTTAEESAELCQRAVPLLTRFATTLSDHDITNWVGHQLEALRAEKAAKELAGYRRRDEQHLSQLWIA